MPARLRALSPRRRALVVGVATGVAVAMAAGLIAGAVRLVADRSVSGPPQDRPGPVLLVPGYGGRIESLQPLAERIRAAGRTASVVALPGNGTGDLAEQARRLDARVAEALRSGAPSVDVIGYSAGGVVARLWAHDHDGGDKARRVVTIGSPHNGAAIAALGDAAGGAACPLACQQLAPRSQLLRRLGDGVPDRPAWMSLWTTEDETVTPPESSRLDGAVNVPLQNLCPGVHVGHSGLPTQPLVTAIVLRAIGPAPLTPPSPTDCRAFKS